MKFKFKKFSEDMDILDDNLPINEETETKEENIEKYDVDSDVIKNLNELYRTTISVEHKLLVSKYILFNLGMINVSRKIDERIFLLRHSKDTILSIMQDCCLTVNIKDIVGLNEIKDFKDSINTIIEAESQYFNSVNNLVKSCEGDWIINTRISEIKELAVRALNRAKRLYTILSSDDSIINKDLACEKCLE